MPRAKGKIGKRSSKGTLARNSRKPVDLAEIRQQVKNQVGQWRVGNGRRRN